LRMGDAQAVIALLEPIEKTHSNGSKSAKNADDANDANGLAIAYMLGMAYLRAGKRISGRCGSIASCATASRLKRTC
jgi:hypothetical protein